LERVSSEIVSADCHYREERYETGVLRTRRYIGREAVRPIWTALIAKRRRSHIRDPGARLKIHEIIDAENGPICSGGGLVEGDNEVDARLAAGELDPHRDKIVFSPTR
jgi:hypothetical protein